MAKANPPLVGIIMGSDSDLKIMEAAAEILKQFNVPYELDIVSAHRTPMRMMEYATSALDRGLKVIIAGAGGAAHLPGMIASLTILPVIGVPIKSSNSIDGWDSVLSILQMPNGVPVATIALNAAKNAGILATEILALSDEILTKKLMGYKKEMMEDVEKKAGLLATEGEKRKHEQ
ncbi:MAG TPA: 5-(carboxyamino)imidazole ribonucleotide mutase [Hanamia sp.]|nr:5-(carboxyamino)imidazole ribonucleotide mutase [Hanamia sp.]